MILVSSKLATRSKLLYAFTTEAFGLKQARLPEIIAKYSQKKPIMIFCYTRKSAVATAKLLANLWATKDRRDRFWPEPSQKTVVEDLELRSKSDLLDFQYLTHSRYVDFWCCLSPCWPGEFRQVCCRERISGRPDFCNLLHLNSCCRRQSTVPSSHYQKHCMLPG